MMCLGSVLSQTPARAVALCVVFLLTITLSGCGSSDSRNTVDAPPDVGPVVDLQPVLDSIVAVQNVSNTALLVEVGDPPASFGVAGSSFVFQGSAGIADPDSGLPMTPNHPFRIASVTKTMTAVVVLQLMESGYVSLDTGIGEIFSDIDMPAGYQVADLHAHDGVRRGAQITVRQLLNHTSGLENYLSVKITAEDGPDELALRDALNGGASGDAGRQWSASELLAHYFHTGRAAIPVALPGEKHYYSDTNYLLLGLMIEKLTGDSYASQLRSRILSPLNMNHSYLEWYEPVYGDSPVEHYSDLDEPIGNMGIVSLALNTSFDWAAGGVVSTIGDLNKFSRALINGAVFEQDETLSLMQAWVPDEEGGFYGLGLERGTVSRLAMMGHAGSWGAYLHYFPELDTTVALWINQVAENPISHIEHVLELLSEAGLAIPDGPLESVTQGEDSPIVVFDNGLGDDMNHAWELVFFDVADFATTFAYNRRGNGESALAYPDPSTLVRSGLEMVEDLRETLQSQQLPPPYVLVGHSLGGPNMELFAKFYPEEVAGVVFVDPRPVGYTEACIQILHLPSCDIAEDELATFPDVIRAEYLGSRETGQLITSLGDFGDTPVTVLSRTTPAATAEELAELALWQDLLQALAAQSSVGTYMAVPEASHYIQYDAPEVVIQSIRQLVTQSRN